jgi:hypothetical protein
MTHSVLKLAEVSRKQQVYAIVVIALSLLVLSPSILLQGATHVLGGSAGDTAIYIWLSNLFPFQVEPATWFETNGFYPYAQSLAFSDNWILPAAIFFCMKSVGLSAALSWNCIFLMTLIALGYCSFLLLYSVTEHRILSIAFGIIAPQLAPIQAHFGHPQMLHMWIVPLVLYLLLHWIASQNKKTAFALGIALTMSFLCSIYLTFFAGMLVLLVIAWWTARLASGERFTNTMTLLFFMAVGLLPVIPFLLPYRDVLQAFGERGYWEPHAFQATIASFFSFGSFHWLYAPLFSLSHSEASLGVGIICILITLLACIRATKHRSFRFIRIGLLLALACLSITTLYPATPWLISTTASWISCLLMTAMIINMLRLVRRKTFTAPISNHELIVMFSVLALFFMVISFGPISRPDIPSYSPFYFFYHFVPGAAGFRAISRAGIITGYLMTLISFISLALLWETQKKYRFCLCCTACILLENLTGQFPFEPPAQPPHALTQLDATKLPVGTVMMTLPYAKDIDATGGIKSFFSFASDQNQTLLASAPYGVQSINGFTGIRTRLVTDLPAKLQHFPDAYSLQTLSTFVDLRSLIVPADVAVRAQHEYPSYISDIIVADDGSALLDFHGHQTCTHATAATLLLPAATKTVRCHVDTKDLQPEGIHAVVAHSQAVAPTTFLDNQLTMTLPQATKAVPFITLQVRLKHPGSMTLSNCQRVLEY